MNISIDTAVSQHLPRFSLGIIEYEGVSVSDSPKMLQGRINFFVEMLRLDRSIETITEIPGVLGWRAAFKKLGTDPSRYRPSSEALLRRLLQGNPFFWVNSAVDVNNFFSVHHALPFGIYDKSTLRGNIVCRIGQAADCYLGLNGREMDMNNKLLLADDEGAFGSPIVDSVRSKVTENSSSLIQFLFFHENVSTDEAEQALGSAARMFVEVNGGTVEQQQLLHA